MGTVQTFLLEDPSTTPAGPPNCARRQVPAIAIPYRHFNVGISFGSKRSKKPSSVEGKDGNTAFCLQYFENAINLSESQTSKLAL